MEDGVWMRGLSAPVTRLRGVGPALEKNYREMGVVTQSDLLSLVPRAFEDRSHIVPVDSVADGGWVNTKIRITGHGWFGGRSFRDRVLKITARDTEGKERTIQLLCFGRNFLEHSIHTGEVYWLYGLVQRYNGQVQCSRFEIKPAPEEGMPPGFGRVYPVYPLHGSLTQRIIRRNIAEVLSSVRHFHDELPPYLVAKYGLMTTDQAVRNLHSPLTMEMEEKARKTLAFTELLYMQLFTRRRAPSSKAVTRAESGPCSLELRLIASLPFSLTPDQMKSLREIRADIDSPQPMNRLLQGDVGSGKTLVAWISALHVIHQGRQVAFMAPTELLARQHADNAVTLLGKLGIRLAYLTGAVKGRERTLLLQNIKEGNVDIVIGTHALFSRDVVFKDLGYVIIDEQHRFGVEQREALANKAKVPDLLLMTATPIPRTLALTVFGDLNVSTLKTMPPGRKPVKTLTVSEKSRERMYRAIAGEFRLGHQVYFVYPRIDDSGESDLRDVTSMYEYLKKEYPGVPSGLLHSKLDEDEKMRILSAFKRKELLYLVSTSVVEVGIDIPDATCMVIEHAERFGLAALHQLRGRVGRSTLQSYCFLVFGDDLTDDAKKRLTALKESNDGFWLAEQDLLIRGPGDIAGLKQSGFIGLKYASLTSDLDLLSAASQAVTGIIRDDPGLLKPENAVIRRCIAESPMFAETPA